MRMRPRTFTKAEDFIDALSTRILADKGGYNAVASGASVSRSTIANIANRKTRWPRPGTFFPLLDYFGISIRVEEDRR